MSEKATPGEVVTAISKKQFISDLREKDLVESTFIVKYIAVMEGRDGRQYLNIVLTDNSGDLEGRSWSNATAISAEISKGDLVKIKGKINLYQGKKQLVLQAIEKIPLAIAQKSAVYKASDYIVASSKDPVVVHQLVVQIIKNLNDHHIRLLLEEIWADQDIVEKVLIWPAGKSVHHTYQSGLLEHIFSCVELAIFLANHYQLNENYLVAAAIIHDICKIYELDIVSGTVTDYSDQGKLLGHVVGGVELLEKFSQRIPDFPPEVKIHLKHILLTHHGEYMYGAPKLPQTREALLFHLIDLMDSKMSAMEVIIKGDQNLGNWSAYIKHFERTIFKRKLPTL
ncbi:MAG: HD domain-containing protein [Oligoflexia bacterium]|nr:HD domain-containing protein [Oligoflexia bacterium]